MGVRLSRFNVMILIRRSLKHVINLLSRDGLQPRAKPYRTRPSDLGLRPGFDLVRLNHLTDELEVDWLQEGEARLRSRAD